MKSDLTTKKVVAALISKNNLRDEFLFVMPTKDWAGFNGYYHIPAGHVEKSESSEAAMVRELREELGVEAKILKKLATTGGDFDDVIVDWFECSIVPEEDFTLQEDEIKEARYFSRNELNTINIWPATKKLFDNHVLK